MEIEVALRTYLLTKVATKNVLIDEISEAVSLPAIVMSKISDTKDHIYSGQTKLEQPVFQFTAFDTAKLKARAVTNEIKLALCDYSGVLSGITIQRISLISEIGGVERQADEKVYYENLEFEVSFIKG